MAADYLELSYSRIQEFECPLAYKVKYLDKITFPESNGNLGTMLHGALEHYWRSRKDGNPISIEEAAQRYAIEDKRFPLNSAIFLEALSMLQSYIEKKYAMHKTIDVEHEFHIILGNGVPITGKIDRVDEWDNNTIEIIDYKSNSWPFDDKEIEDSLQLKMYALVARHLYPGRKVVCTFDFIRWGRKSIMFTDQELDNTELFLDSVYERILSETDWAPRPNDKCRFCHNVANCAAMKAAIDGGHLIDLGSLSDDELLENLLKYVAISNSFEKLAASIKTEVRTRIGRSRTGKLETDKYSAGMICKGVSKVDASTVVRNKDSLGLKYEHLDRIMTVSKQQLLKLAKASAKHDAERLSVAVPGFPFVSVERKKNV